MKWIHITESHLKQILDWRTSEEVTRFMYTDIEYNLDNQKKWLQTIRSDENGRYWLMKYKGKLIGYISITEIEWKHKRGHWNFYIGDLNYSMIAGYISAYMYNYAFNELEFEKLVGEVMEENEGVRALHQKMGAREVGFYEKHIFKNKKWHDVYVYEMTKEKWELIGQRFCKFKPEVEMQK